MALIKSLKLYKMSVTIARKIKKRGEDNMAYIRELSNNKYKVIISDGFNPDGTRKRVTKTITAKSKRELEKKVTELEVMCRSSKQYNGNMKFKEVVEQWWEMKQSEVVDKTSSRYEEIIKNSLIPYFGRKKLKDINKKMIESYIAELGRDGIRKDGKKGGYSQQTKLHHFRLLWGILEYATNNELIEKNICKAVKAPIVRKVKEKEYTIEKIYQIQEKLESEPIKYRVFINLALATGARKGELLGIEWKDIDFKSKKLKLCRTSMDIRGKGVITKDTLKNGDTSRVLGLPDEVIILLEEYKNYQEEYKKEHKDIWIETDRLFTQHNGRAMHPSAPANWFKKFQHKNQLERITLHELRHINISALIRRGIDVVKVAKWAGHKDAQVTLRIYAHVLDEEKDEEVKVIGETFFDKGRS